MEFVCTLKYPFPIPFIGRGKIILTVKIIFMYMEKSSQQIGVPCAFWHLTGDAFQESLEKVMPIWPPTGNMTWSWLLKLVKPWDIYLDNWGDDNTELIYQPVSVPWGESTWNLLHIAWQFSSENAQNMCATAMVVAGLSHVVYLLHNRRCSV